MIALQTGLPGTGGPLFLLVPLLALLAFVVVPTVGMYREAAAHDPGNVAVWTVAMLVLAVVAPLLGPVVLWVVYTVIVVRNEG